LTNPSNLLTMLERAFQGLKAMEADLIVLDPALSSDERVRFWHSITRLRRRAAMLRLALVVRRWPPIRRGNA